jgi:hypothetical protein
VGLRRAKDWKIVYVWLFDLVTFHGIIKEAKYEEKDELGSGKLQKKLLDVCAPEK